MTKAKTDLTTRPFDGGVRVEGYVLELYLILHV